MHSICSAMWVHGLQALHGVFDSHPTKGRSASLLPESLRLRFCCLTTFEPRFYACQRTFAIIRRTAPQNLLGIYFCRHTCAEMPRAACGFPFGIPPILGETHRAKTMRQRSAARFPDFVAAPKPVSILRPTMRTWRLPQGVG